MAVVEEASRTSPQSKVEAHRRAIATQKAIIVKFLEANGFRKDVNCKGTEEEQVCYTYPLHVAVKQENAAMVELLLHFGAKAKQKDYKGKTACDYAKSAPEILKIFELYGDATKPWDAYFARLQQHPCLVAPRKTTRSGSQLSSTSTASSPISTISSGSRRSVASAASTKIQL